MKLLKKMIEWSLFVVLLTPLLLSKNFLFPFVSAKGFFFYVVMEIILLLASVWLLKNNLPKTKNKIFYFYVALVLFRIFLDIFGVSFFSSFWGSYERMVGVYTSLHFLLFLLLLSVFYGQKERCHRLLNVSLAVSVLVCIYAVLQKLGIYFWVVIPGDIRVYATFGNTAFLAGYLLMQLHFSAYFILVKKEYKWKMLYSAVLALNLLVLIWTATRGAFVALIVSALVSLLACLFIYKNLKLRLAIIGTLFLLVTAVSSVFIFKNSNIVQSNMALRRISYISLNDSTTKSRILLWQSALTASQDKILAGWGENNVRLALDRHYDGQLQEDWFDSTHNQFLDVLLANGVLGFVAYFGFFIFLLWRAWNLRKNDPKIAILFFSLFLSYYVANFFLFENFINSLFFVVALGFLIAVEDSYSKEKITVVKYFKIPKIFIVIILFLVVPVLLYISWKNITAMSYITRGSRLLRENTAEAIVLYNKGFDRMSFAYDNATAKIYEDVSKIVLDRQGIGAGDVANLLELTTKMSKKTMSTIGGYSYFYINLAKIYQAVTPILGSSYLENSFGLLSKARVASPNRVDVFFVLAQGYFLQGKYDQAEKTLYDSLQLHSREVEVYYNLAQIQMRQGDPVKGLESLKKMKETGSKVSSSDLEVFAKILVTREKWPELLQLFLWMDELYPKDENNYNNIITIYKKLGDSKKANEWVQKMNGLTKKI